VAISEAAEADNLRVGFHYGDRTHARSLSRHALGATAAVLLEVAIIVTASWAAARRLLSHRSFTLLQCAAMGVTAFTLTMASEVMLAGLLRGQDARDWVKDIATPLGLTGSAGQIAFTVVPIFVALRYKTPRRSV
jgi:hypothetical protein